MRTFVPFGLCSLLALAACSSTSNNNNTVSHELTVSPSGSGSGEVTSSPAGIECGSTCGASFDEGSTVVLTAAADPGSSFSGWTGCDSTSGLTCTVEMSADKTVEPTFDVDTDTFTFTIEGTGSGTVTDDQGGTWTSSWTATYLDGATVTFTATPDGSDTVTWGGDCAGTTGNTCTVTIGSTTTVSVSFDLPVVYDDVSVTIGGTGSGTVGDGSGMTWTSGWTGSYPDGSEVTFTATPDAHDMATWSGACAGATGNTCTITVSTGLTVSVSFDPADLSALAATAHLQSVDLSWSPAMAAGGVSGYDVYVSTDGGSTFGAAQFTTSTSMSFTGLVPESSFVYLVTTVYADSTESTGATATATTALSGSVADFTADQKVSGLNGRDFYFTWTGTRFYAAIAKGSQGEALDLTNGDSLFIAFDTDPSGSDVNGVATIPGPSCDGSNCPSWEGTTDVALPFNLDVGLYLTNLGGTPTVESCAVALGCAQPSSASGVIAPDDSVAEVAIDAAALGNPAQARVAFFAQNLILDPTNGPSGSGYTFDLAPVSVTGGTDVTGYFASITSSLDLGTTLFDPASAATSASGATPVDAPALVTFTVDTSGAGLSQPPGIFGSIHPLTYAGGTTSYTLTATADGYSGTFNFGGQQGNLFFVWTDGNPAGATQEFSPGSDRLWILSGGNDVLPALTYDVSYNSTVPHTLTIDFDNDSGPDTGRIPQGLVGDFWGWTFGPGNPTLSSTGTNAYTTGPLDLGDLIANPGDFKVWYGDTTSSGYEQGSNHNLSVDLLQDTTLIFTSGDGASL